jgi:hypothetical protein
MISVTVCINQTWATCETDAHYSPDLLDDLTTQAATTVLATIAKAST